MTDTTNNPNNQRPAVSNSQQPEIDDMLCECIDCKKMFTFERGEISFFRSKGLAFPKRCPACRKLRKTTINRPFNVDDNGGVDGNKGINR